MAARLQQSGDGFAAQISTMSKSQLYDLMCQVKVMIEQNQNQARQVLIDNPVLTRTLFQAQIMLGMVQPPKVMPNIQQVSSQPEPTQAATKPENKPTAPPPALPPQPPSAPLPSITLQPHPIPVQPNPLPQPLPSLQQQQKPGNFLPPPPSSVPQQFNLPTHFAIGNFNQPPPPPLHPPMAQQQPRMQVPGMQQQFSNPMMMMPNAGMGFQPGAVSGPGPGPQQMMPPQPGFVPSGMPPSSFPQAQPPLPGQQPPQQIYQGGGTHMNIDYGMHSGMPMPSDRPGPWGAAAAGHPDMPSSARPQIPGPPPFMANQLGQPMAGQGPRPHLTNEMQQALLDQVRSLTPDQINMLPPDQRQQVLQLQEMLR